MRASAKGLDVSLRTPVTRIRWDAQVKLLTLNETEHLRAAAVERLDRTGDL